MNQNTRKLLLWMYGLELANLDPIRDLEISRLLASYSSSGRRSFLSQLRREQLIVTQVLANQKEYYLTSHARKALEAEFPVLNDKVKNWQGEWAVLVFISSLPHDPQFRYLRQMLLDHQAGQLSRGVYLYPLQFPDEILQQEEYYRGGFTILHVNRWAMGDERSIITSVFNLSDVAEITSSVGKEIEQLLTIFNSKKILIDQRLDHIVPVFDRLTEAFGAELGITYRYFPRVRALPNLLSSLLKLTYL